MATAGAHYAIELSKIFAGLDPRPTVRHGKKGAPLQIMVRKTHVAEFAPGQGFRLVTETDWRPLRYTRPHEAEVMRTLVADAIEATSPKVVVAPPQTEHERAEAFCDALTACGLEAIVRDREVEVDDIGSITLCLGSDPVKAAERIARDETERLRTELDRVLGLELPGNPRLSTVDAPGRVSIRVDRVNIATVNAFQALAINGVQTPIDGVLDGGPALGAVQQAVRRALAGSAVTARKRTPAPVPRGGRVLMKLPRDLTADARDLALKASAQLRKDRRIAPAAQMEVPTDRGTITFHRLTPGAKPLEAPFHFARGDSEVVGALRLNTIGDPLHMREVRADPPSLVGEAWAAALIVYARITCTATGQPAAPKSERIPTRGPTGSQSAGRDSSSRNASAGGGGQGQHSKILTVSSISTAHDALRDVSGHLRRLSPGWEVSHNAQRAASAVGIELPRGYTWVQPHHRGPVQTIRIENPALRKLW